MLRKKSVEEEELEVKTNAGGGGSDKKINDFLIPFNIEF